MSFDRKTRIKHLQSTNLRVAESQIERIKSLIFLTCDPAFEKLDLDINFLPKLNKENYQICDAYKHDDYLAGVKPCFDEYEKVVKTANKDLNNVDWLPFVNEIAKANSTRTPKEKQETLAKQVKEHISEIKNGIGECVDRFDKNKDGTINSLTTKVCKWIYRFYKEQKDDAFAIYDSIVKSVLPYYAKQNGVAMPNYVWKSYKQYLKVVKEICDKTGLSLQEFDRILWTFYSSNPIQKEIAIALGK